MDKIFYESSIFLEPFQKRIGKNKKSYSQKALALLTHPESASINKKKILTTSMSVIGEIKGILNLDEVKNRYNKNIEEIKEIHDKFIEKCEIIGISTETINQANQILTQDSRLDPLDVLNFSSAISGGCRFFVFIDKNIEESRIINKIAKDKKMALVHFDVKENEDY